MYLTVNEQLSHKIPENVALGELIGAGSSALQSETCGHWRTAEPEGVRRTVRRESLGYRVVGREWTWGGRWAAETLRPDQKGSLCLVDGSFLRGGGVTTENYALQWGHPRPHTPPPTKMPTPISYTTLEGPLVPGCLFSHLRLGSWTNVILRLPSNSNHLWIWMRLHIFFLQWLWQVLLPIDHLSGDSQAFSACPPYWYVCG